MGENTATFVGLSFIAGHGEVHQRPFVGRRPERGRPVAALPGRDSGRHRHRRGGRLEAADGASGRRRRVAQVLAQRQRF